MQVLFVCTGNSFRSPVAEALMRRYKPQWDVNSAGTRPADKIAGNARELLEREGCLEHVKQSPDSVTEEALREVDMIVVMDKEHKRFLLENFKVNEDLIKNWNVEDPINPNVDAESAFKKIKEKVKEM